MKNFTTAFIKVIFPVLKKILDNLFKLLGLLLFLLTWYIFTFENEMFNEIPTNDMIFLATLIIMSQFTD